MKTNSSLNILRVLCAFFAGAALIGLRPVPLRAATFNSFADAISGTYYFPRPILQVAEEPPSESESQSLWQILDGWRASDQKSGLADMEMFLAAYTNSPWAPSLHANLGKFYLDNGYITLALEHWEDAWAATQDYQSGNGKKVADYTLAHWSRLLASLGRFETLAVLLQQNWDRVLDHGPLSQMWARTREAIVEMSKYPGTSYKCGTYALDQVAKTLRLPYDPRGLLRVPSPAEGFSMKALTDLSRQLGLGLVPVFRGTDTKLVVPCLVHWGQEHYGAILSRIGDLYKVVDPTFGQPRFLTADAINTEASGFFMIAGTQIPTGWRMLGAGETSLIRGRGNPNFLADRDDQQCPTCPSPLGMGGEGTGNDDGGVGLPAENGDSGCSNCGMVRYRVSEPWINLWLLDEPLGYQPALGPRISFSLYYKQRDEDPDTTYYSSSAGLNWNCSWLSYVDTRYGLSKSAVFLAAGGKASFITGGVAGATYLNYHNNMRLSLQTNSLGAITNYDMLYTDGSKDVYNFTPTNSDGYSGQARCYLTQKIDPQGHVTSFLYEDYDRDAINIRLKYVVDPDGRTNTISYATNGYSTNLITKVTDPSGRYTTLQYDGNGQLTNITDVAGISSAMAYDGNGWPSSLKTPYGTTSFASVDKGQSIAENIDRYVTITAPTGGKQLYAFVQYPPYEPGYYGASLVPTNTPIGTLDNDPGSSPNERDSYYWNSLQYAALSTTNIDNFTANDYVKARMRHWLGYEIHGEIRSVDTISIQRDASQDGTNMGQLTWFDYTNKGGYGNGDQGDQILPAVVARVLPNGSTWYKWYQRTSVGIPTNIVETYTKTDGSTGTRTNSFVYASNGVDLIKHIGPNGEQVSSNWFNGYHQVLTNYNALNDMTVYSYDANRRLSTAQTPAGLLTTQSYGSDGRLSTSVDSFVGGSALRTNSYTWNSDGTKRTHADERGLAVTNYWDNLQRLTGVLYPDGTISNIYTALDVTATKDRLGNWTYSGYNGIRQKIAETNANSVITRYGHCDCGGLMYVTNAFGTAVQEITSFGYDYQGNRTFIFYPDGTTVTNWYDSLRRPIATADGVGTLWFGYNNQGLRSSITNAAGVEQRIVFDIEDRSYTVMDANGVTVTNTYDNLGRLRTRTYPDNGVESFGYTANIGGATSYTNQLVSNVWTYAYDAAGRKTNEIGVGVYTNTFTYKPAGDLATLKDGKSQVTTWNYDQYGRVTNKVDQASVEILRYKYDAESRLTNRWSVAKSDTKYTYDTVGNLTFVDYPSGTADITLAYDALNRMTNMVDAAGTTKYTYYAGGLLNSEDGPWTSDTVTYTYNNARLRSGLTLQQPTGSWTNGFFYDAARRLTNITSQAGTFAYTYKVGQASSLPIKLLLPNTSYITNTFDNVARLTGTYLKSSSDTILNSHEYLYNAGNQRIRHTRTDASYYTNSYDNIGQLKVADSTVASEDRSYGYDAAWNLNKRTNNATVYTFTVNNKNELTNYNGSTFTYDSNGNLTGAGSWVYDYDAENQLRNVTLPSTQKTDFVNDGRGRLRKRSESIWTNSTWQVTSETRYIYDGMRVIQERDSGNTPTVGYTRGNDLSGTLEGAGGIGGLLGRSHSYTSGSFTNHNFYHADGGGNVTYIVNSSQSSVATYRYDPFGNTISSSGSLAGANVYRFSSKEIHANTGMYYYGYRFYDPNLQRWLNRDPIGEFGFGVIATKANKPIRNTQNLYTFVLNSPTDLVDPSGLKPVNTGVKRCSQGGANNFHGFLVVDGQPYGLYPRNSGGIFDRISAVVFGPGEIDQTDDPESPDCKYMFLDDQDYDIDKFRRCVRDKAKNALGKKQPYHYPFYQCRSWRDDVLEGCKQQARKTPDPWYNHNFSGGAW